MNSAFVIPGISKGVNAMRGEGFGAMIITHYQRLLNYITPDVVHVMMEGKVVLSGGPELAARLGGQFVLVVGAGVGSHHARNQLLPCY